MSTPTLTPQHRARTGPAGTSRITRALSILSATALVALGAITTSSPALAALDDPITFTDANLQACVNETLDPARDAAADITEAEAASLDDHLECVIDDISSLDGLEYFTNLKVLDLGTNQIPDVSALGSLTNLEALYLDDNQVSDVSALGSLTNLEVLDLGINQILDVSALGSLTNLERLYLGNNQIADLSPLSGLTPIMFAVGNQTVGLGNVVVGQNTANPVIDRTGDPVGLSDLYDPATNTFSPSTLGDDSVTWDDGNGFTGTLNFTAVDAPAAYVTFTDANLQACVNETLDPARDADADVTEAEAASIDELRCDNEGISSLDGMEHFTGLEVLWLPHNEIAVLDALANLTSLESLNLWANQVAEIDALANLTSLRYLYLHENEITEVDALSNLTSLDILLLGYNHIADLSPLASLTPSDLGAGYQTVDVGDLVVDEPAPNPIVDQAGDPVALSDLYDSATNTFSPTALGDDSVTWDDGDVFTGTLNFTAMDAPASYVNFTDANLQACVNKTLDPARDADADVTEAEAASIDDLECINDDISSLDGLEHFLNLQRLYLFGNEVHDVTPLENLTALGFLNLSNNQITDEGVRTLGTFPSLTDLYLSENQITDVSPLANLTSLRYLHFHENQITDVSPLAGLTDLRSLGFNANHVVDVSPLAGLTRLQSLGFNANHVMDVSPLSGLSLIRFSAENQTVDLGNVIVDQDAANPVIDRDGDPVALSDLYDPATNTFTPTILGADSVTWDDGDTFTGTLSFTVVEAAGDDPGGNGDASNEQLPQTGAPAFILPVGFAALALLGTGAALVSGSRRRNRLTAREG